METYLVFDAGLEDGEGTYWGLLEQYIK